MSLHGRTKVPVPSGLVTHLGGLQRCPDRTLPNKAVWWQKGPQQKPARNRAPEVGLGVKMGHGGDSQWRSLKNWQKHLY